MAQSYYENALTPCTCLLTYNDDYDDDDGDDDDDDDPVQHQHCNSM